MNDDIPEHMPSTVAEAFMMAMKALAEKDQNLLEHVDGKVKNWMLDKHERELLSKAMDSAAEVFCETETLEEQLDAYIASEGDAEVAEALEKYRKKF